MDSFQLWFESFTGLAPRPWQVQLGGDAICRSRLIRIPTGYGKTLGALAAWTYNRVHRNDASWPRRLVWTLPMRALAEQTSEVARDHLDRSGRLWVPGHSHTGRVGVHLLMGGEEPGGDWNLYPEECAVFVGTQDMLLSRALNRGYAAARARWPMEFGLLNHDTLWILDEVQLMDVGLATSAQLQAYFDDDVSRGFKPRVSWWMSATLQPDWLRSVDTAAHHRTWITSPLGLPAQERASGPASVYKALARESIGASSHADFARHCADTHAALADADFGRITLVVCNTVERACKTHEALEKLRVGAQIELVHSRFRPHERASWRSRFLERSACRSGANRIIVATQVVEAGVDITAGALVTELAPWSSLVQRFGRCARYGGAGRVLVVDRGRDDKSSAPYAPEQLDSAAGALDTLIAKAANAGIAALEAYEESLTPAARATLYPYRPQQLLIRRELDELFDTTPDLTGADIDVSRFIRSGDERDLSVFWIEVPKTKKGQSPAKPPEAYRPTRQELCGIPFLRAQEWLCGRATSTDRKPRLRSGIRAWAWDWINGTWEEVDRASLIPGKVVCVAADVGGYRPERGFDPDSTASVTPVSFAREAAAQDEADDAEDSERLSATAYKTIATHDREVGEQAGAIASALNLPPRLTELIVLAGRWHDIGKAHNAFQGAIRAPQPKRLDLAKAPDGAWQRPVTYPASATDHRRGFRHELASCLALFGVLLRYSPAHPALLGPWVEVLGLLSYTQIPKPVADPSTATSLERAVLACTAEEFDLLAYLVLSHHGKVRVALHAGPKDQMYVDHDGRGLPIRGVREGDVLPGIEIGAGERLPDLELFLSPAALGLSGQTGRSWRDRTLGLMKARGPAALAWLEALIIAADRRASQLATTDPLLDSPHGGIR